MSKLRSDVETQIQNKSFSNYVLIPSFAHMLESFFTDADELCLFFSASSEIL